MTAPTSAFAGWIYHAAMAAGKRALGDIESAVAHMIMAEHASIASRLLIIAHGAANAPRQLEHKA
jgi:hypothetical protein